MPIFVESGYFRQNHHLLFNTIQAIYEKDSTNFSRRSYGHVGSGASPNIR